MLQHRGSALAAAALLLAAQATDHDRLSNDALEGWNQQGLSQVNQQYTQNDNRAYTHANVWQHQTLLNAPRAEHKFPELLLTAANCG
jgi:CHASE2 domain-containing sensor protein